MDTCSRRVSFARYRRYRIGHSGHVFGEITFGYAEDKDETPCFHAWDEEMWNCSKPDVSAWMPQPDAYRPGEVLKAALCIPMQGGHLTVEAMPDENYPGVDVTFVPDKVDEERLEPRV